MSKARYAAIKLVGGTEYESLLAERRATRKRSRLKHLEANRARDREAQKQGYRENPDKFRDRKRIEYQQKRKKFLEEKRLWRLQNPEKAKEKDRRAGLKRDKEAVRARERTRRYGITPEQFDALKKVQSNKCAICSKELTERAHLDHCHKTGRVRGLLCGPCNAGIGMFGDDPHRLRQALNYLEQTISEARHGSS